MMRHRSICLSHSALLCLIALAVAGTVSVSAESETPTGDVDLVAMFQGEWQMRGKFRYSPEVDWIPTRSELVASGKVDQNVVFRDITASQINFSAIDLITYNPETKAIQYIYVSTESTSAYIYEGTCRDDCRHLEFDQQLCGPAWPWPTCEGRTTITFESGDRFVARDYRPDQKGEEFMSREVVYTREAAGAE